MLLINLMRDPTYATLGLSRNYYGEQIHMWFQKEIIRGKKPHPKKWLIIFQMNYSYPQIPTKLFLLHATDDPGVPVENSLLF